MLRKLANKINSKIQADEEEITFKRYDDEASSAASRTAESDLATGISQGAGSVLRADESEKDSSIKFKVMKPKSFDDVSSIADQLIAGYTVFFNAELLGQEDRNKMLLFLNGVTYTTDGDIRQASQNTYIITPHDVDVSDED